MRKLAVSECPLCSGKKRNQLRVSRVGAFESALVQCEQCRLKYLDRIYPPEKLYAEHTITRGEMLETLRPEERNHDDYLKEIKKGSFLEIGFGDGKLLRRAKKLGFDVVGNEISDSGAARRLRKEGIPISIGDVRNVSFNRKFDVVFLSHVIEHLHDVGSYLEAFHKLLKQEGRLVLLTPNYNNLFRFLLPLQRDPFRKFVKKDDVVYVSPKRSDGESLQWCKTLEFGHVFQFEKPTIKKLVEKHGFSLLKQGSGRGPDLGKGGGLIKRVIFNSVTNLLLKLFDNAVLKPFDLQYELFLIFGKK